MPVKLQIDGGEQYLPYAKKRLALLQEQLLRQGLRTGTRRYKIADAEIEVHVWIPVDVASGQPRPERAQNRIRINGGFIGALFLEAFPGFPPPAPALQGVASRLGIGAAEGDPIFSTPGVTRLGARLTLAGYKKAGVFVQGPSTRDLSPKDKLLLVHAPDDALAAGTALFHSKNGRLFAGGFFDSTVIAVGDEIVLGTGFTQQLNLVHAVLVDKKLNLLYRQQETKLIHLNGPDIEDWYRDRDLKVRKTGRLGDVVRFRLGAYHYDYTTEAPAGVGTFVIDDSSEGLGHFGA